MIALCRQQLVWLDADTWRRVTTQLPAGAGWDERALECLEYWARSDLPLVVARQPHRGPGRAADEPLTLGLPAPACWERRRLCVEVPAGSIRRVGTFPSTDAIAEHLPASARDDWHGLCAGLQRLQVAAHVYGSYGWQQLTGLAYLHAHSDLDLLILLDTARQADAAVALLQAGSRIAPRIDGELVFSDGAAIPWREWAAWRAGTAERVLVKRLHDAALEDPRLWAAA